MIEAEKLTESAEKAVLTLTTWASDELFLFFLILFSFLPFFSHRLFNLILAFLFNADDDEVTEDDDDDEIASEDDASVNDDDDEIATDNDDETLRARRRRSFRCDFCF